MSANVMWRVRLDDGSEYGPVDEGKLLSWAREGRITSSSQISSDGTTWIFAPQKPELGMEWLIEISSGEYFGPFHYDVVKELLDSKKITSETRTFRLSDKSEPALKSEIGKLRADYERVKSEKEDASKRAQSQVAEIEQLKTVLRKVEFELASSREDTAAERIRADRIAAELKSAEERRSRETAELERMSSERVAETARANGLAREVDQLNAALDSEKSQGEQLRSTLAAISKREAVLAEEAKDRSTTLKQLKSALEGTQAKLERAEAHGTELEAAFKASEGRGEAVAAELAEAKSAQESVRSELATSRTELATSRTELAVAKTELEASRSELAVAQESADKDRAELAETRVLLAQTEARGTELEAALKASEEKCNVLATEVESEQDRSRKFGELLSASACREASLAEEARSLRDAKDQTSACVKELSEELELARAEVVKERKASCELRVALEKAEKAGKRSGLGNLFQGRSLRDLSLLELAAQRELARQKRGRGPSGPNRSNLDVIDV